MTDNANFTTHTETRSFSFEFNIQQYSSNIIALQQQLQKHNEYIGIGTISVYGFLYSMRSTLTSAPMSW